MKRQLIIGLILLVLIGVCFGAYFGVDYYQNKKSEESAQEAAALQLSSFTSDDVTKLVLHTPELDYTIGKDDSGDWTVEDGNELHINTYYITALCTYGCSLTATKDLGTVDSGKMETYGLSDPITISYYTSDSDTPEKTLKVGNQNATKESFYVMKDDDDHVYLADADTVGYLYVTKTQLRYRYLMEDMSSDLTEFSLEKNGSVVYRFVDENGNSDWTLQEPVQTRIGVDNSTISSLFLSLTELEADDFGDSGVTEEKYADYGFDNPAYQFQFKQSTGEVTTILVEDYDPLSTSYVNCLHVETNEILVFESSYLSFLQTDISDYLVDTVYKEGIEAVSELKMSYHGSFNDKTLDIDTDFTIDKENSTYTCDGTTITEDDGDLLEAFETFYTALSNTSYESLETVTEIPEDTDPALHLEYTLLEDDSVHTVDLVKRDDTTYWAFLDGEFTYAVVRQRALSSENKMLEAYTALQTALESAAA